ncbi:MAG TPA: class I SAM-dependent methyltransferase [Candidatus Acidoferrum sp.]|nr:class I SAM-dependent methyltransferase [Candidatus Acidoferrum sp.]
MNRIHHWYCRSSPWRRRVENTLLLWALGNAALNEPALESGPGPGVTTDYLRTKVRSLTVLECDLHLAENLRARFCGTNVRVIEGDGASMPFECGSFRTVFCFTMLHHLPSTEMQDRVIAEAFRVLAPGGTFVGTDSRAGLRVKLFHWFDTMVIVDPRTFPRRLKEAGFSDAQMEITAGAFRFRAVRP